MDVITIEDLLDDYQKELKTKGKLQNTIDYYVRDIRMLLDDTRFNTTNEKDINDFSDLVSVLDTKFSSMHEQNEFSKNTISRKASSINNFFRYLREHGLVKITPQYSTPRDLNLTPPINQEQFLDLMDCIPHDNVRNSKHRAIIILAYSTGVTSEEIVRLSHSDFIRSKDEIIYLKLNTNRKSGRILEVDEQTNKELINYERLSSQDSVSLDSVSNYFINQHSKPLSSRWVRKMFGRWAKIAELGEELNFNSLRVAYARRLLDMKDISLNEIAYKMGIKLPHAKKLADYYARD